MSACIILAARTGELLAECPDLIDACAMVRKCWLDTTVRIVRGSTVLAKRVRLSASQREWNDEVDEVTDPTSDRAIQRMRRKQR